MFQSVAMLDLPTSMSVDAPPSSFDMGCKSFVRISVQDSAESNFDRTPSHVLQGLAETVPGRRLSDFYQLKGEVGQGAFGVVREAVDLATGAMFCCKSIPKAKLTPDNFADIRQEAEIMMHLRGHPNVVEIMGLFEDDTHIHIVEEMCSGGDLYSLSSKARSLYTEKEIAGIMRSVLMVLQHCHAMGVMYRDCKPDNFLLSSKGPDAILKATDFGISKFLRPEEKLEVFCGTPTYMAPEVFDMSYSYPADVWSAGVMMYWVLCGEFPFKGRNDMELARSVYAVQPRMEGGVWDKITPDAKELILLMLQKNPSKRPTPTELLEHKWFKEMAKVKAPKHSVLQRLRTYSQTSLLFRRDSKESKSKDSKELKTKDLKELKSKDLKENKTEMVAGCMMWSR